jgi:hypothetical protein
MRRAVIYAAYLIIFVVLLLAPAAVRYLRFYGVSGAEQAAPPVYEPASVPARVPTPAASDFVDEPEVGQGWVLLDQSHDNRFELAEINYLDSRLAARGYELQVYEDGDLATALRPASALLVIAPMTGFDPEEVLAVEEFVERGGRLLLVGDPTRFELTFDEEEDFDPFSYSIETDDIALNSLANAFDLVFNGDYLYNTVDSEGNFQNIILRQDGFGEDTLTRGLEQLAFYGSHSIQTGTNSQPLLSADENTWSSATDRRGGLALAAKDRSGRVLAVGDIDFLSEPYYTVYDNSRFISQLADFLVGAQRAYVMADFPYFYDQSVELVYTGDPELGPDAFDEVVGLQRALRLSGRTLALTGEPGEAAGVLYAGLYNQAAEVSDRLEAAGVSLVIDPPLEAEEASGAAAGREPDSGAAAGREPDNGPPPGDDDQQEDEQIGRLETGLGDLQMSGTALLLFAAEADPPEVIVLAASAAGLESALARLIGLSTWPAEPALADCLLQDDLALCPTGLADEPLEAELITSGQPAQAPAEGPEEDEPGGGPGELELNADIQGSISLGDSLDGTLAEEQAHGWEFGDGPATVNIILQAGDDMDAILELYDAEGALLAAADSTFDGEIERLDLIQFLDDQTYTIVVRDFYDDGGSYTLDLLSVTAESLGALDQGQLTPGQAVDGALAEGEKHAWRFALEAPATADIILTSGPDLDGLLILFGPDGSVLEVVDQTFIGEEEALLGYSLEETGEYTIVVSEYSDGGGEYALLLELD